jgi:hypothetical protein
MMKSKALKKAAILYAQGSNNMPFFCSKPTQDRPKLDLFGRTPPALQEQGTGAQGAAGDNSGRAGTSRGRGRSSGGRARTSREQAETDVEERDMGSSVCDRLRNAAARTVVLAHKLLGDPAVVGETAPQQARQWYFEELDRQAAELLSKCKIWLGGKTYDSQQGTRYLLQLHACYKTNVALCFCLLTRVATLQGRAGGAGEQCECRHPKSERSTVDRATGPPKIIPETHAAGYPGPLQSSQACVEHCGAGKGHRGQHLLGQGRPRLPGTTCSPLLLCTLSSPCAYTLYNSLTGHWICRIQVCSARRWRRRTLTGA